MGEAGIGGAEHAWEPVAKASTRNANGVLSAIPCGSDWTNGRGTQAGAQAVIREGGIMASCTTLGHSQNTATSTPTPMRVVQEPISYELTDLGRQALRESIKMREIL